MLFTFCSINKIKIKKLSCLRALFANRDFQLYSLFSTFNNIQRDILFYKLLYVMCVCNQWNPPKLITFSLLCTCHLLLDCPLWSEWTLQQHLTTLGEDQESRNSWYEHRETLKGDEAVFENYRADASHQWRQGAASGREAGLVWGPMLCMDPGWVGFGARPTIITVY